VVIRGSAADGLLRRVNIAFRRVSLLDPIYPSEWIVCDLRFLSSGSLVYPQSPVMVR